MHLENTLKRTPHQRTLQRQNPEVIFRSPLREESADQKDKVKSIAAIKNQIEIMRRRRKPIQAVRFGRYFSERTYDSEEAKEIRKKHGEK